MKLDARLLPAWKRERKLKLGKLAGIGSRRAGLHGRQKLSALDRDFQVGLLLFLFLLAQLQIVLPGELQRLFQCQRRLRGKPGKYEKHQQRPPRSLHVAISWLTAEFYPDFFRGLSSSPGCRR